MFEGCTIAAIDKDLLIKAVMKFGIDKRKQYAAAALMELGQALLKDLNKEPHNVEEAMANVEIMLAQMRLVYNQYNINGFIDAKLEKLKREIRYI